MSTLNLESLVSELSSGKGDILLVVAGVAVLVGLSIVWRMVKAACEPSYRGAPLHRSSLDRAGVTMEHAQALAINKSIDRHRRRHG